MRKKQGFVFSYHSSLVTHHSLKMAEARATRLAEIVCAAARPLKGGARDYDALLEMGRKLTRQVFKEREQGGEHA
jgi:hypothetical protein